MSILLSGDFHGNAAGELSIITKKSLHKKYGVEKFHSINFHIILGDGGFMWPGNKRTDAYNYRVLGLRPFPVLCVIGNHEPMLGMSLPEIDIGIGAVVYQVNKDPLVAYLKRGAVYRIDGFKFLVMGGALSIDREYRIPGKSWWKEEYWSDEEKTALFDLLAADDSFDYVLAHTGPDSVNCRLFSRCFPHSPKFADEVAALNDIVDSKIHCGGWFCGHWHGDWLYRDEDRRRSYRYLYRDTALIDSAEVDSGPQGILELFNNFSC